MRTLRGGRAHLTVRRQRSRARFEGPECATRQQELRGTVGEHDPEIGPWKLGPVGDTGRDEGVREEEERAAESGERPEPHGRRACHDREQDAVAGDGHAQSGGQVRPQGHDGDDERGGVGGCEETGTRAWGAVRLEEREVAEVARREGGHAGEEGGVGVGQQQDVAAPAAQKGGDQEPGRRGRDGVRSQEGHQERLGDGVPGSEAGGQGGEVDDGGEGEGREECGAGAVGSVGARDPHAGTVSSAVSGIGAGAQPGP